jgi:hypothetical protein
MDLRSLWQENRLQSADALLRESFSLASDRAQSFNQRLALCAILDNE